MEEMGEFIHRMLQELKVVDFHGFMTTIFHFTNTNQRLHGLEQFKEEKKMYDEEDKRFNPFESELLKFMHSIDYTIGQMSEVMNALLPEPMDKKELINKLTAYFKVDLEEYLKRIDSLSKRMDRREKDVQMQLNKIHNNQNKNYLLIRELMDK